VQLTRRRIIAAAMDQIERDGIDAVCLHRLATALGCGVVSLYNYVPSTSALLDGVANEVMSGIELPAAIAGGWQEQIRAQARAFWQVARAHPRCTLVAVSRPPSSAVVLRPVEHALATLRHAGFDGQDALRIVRTITAYIMGAVLGEAAAAPGPGDGDDDMHRLKLRPGEFPNLTALAAGCCAGSPEADFEFGLDLLVRAVAVMQPAGAAAR
jgi:AcrR family transcriptional regulator